MKSAIIRLKLTSSSASRWSSQILLSYQVFQGFANFRKLV